MIWIRADANSEIGTGHVMRCLSIAVALEELGHEVCFVLADESPVRLLQEKGQQYLILQTDYRKMEEELSVLTQMLIENKPEVLLVDSYYVTDKYLSQLKSVVKLAYMDDKAMFPYPVDVLINYNVYGESALYKYLEYEPRNLLMGTKYVPLRQEFRNVIYTVRPKVESILITTGGSDKFNLAGQMMKKVLEDERVNKFHYHLVSGMFNDNLPMLKELEEKYVNVHVHESVSRMSELMQECDIAVSAAGSTMYELCAVGVPIISFSFADNQEPVVESFVKKGLACYGGNYLTQKDKMLTEVVEKIALLSNEMDLRHNLNEAQKAQVDGLGAYRIARHLH